MYLAIQKNRIPGIYEMTPTYRSLMIQYNPLEIEIDRLIEELGQIEKSLDSIELPEPRIVEIPTIYGGEYGEDLGFVAEHCGMSEAEVVKLHTSVDYRIYMLGFSPGFPYLGGMSEKIETPRLKIPRTKIPVGSVGIAGKQTGIYPMESPGGWQLIGRTPLKLYDPQRQTPIMLQAGDYIRFVPIDNDEYERIRILVEKNQYEVNTLAGEVGQI
jgi:inhibitor of KinA